MSYNKPEAPSALQGTDVTGRKGPYSLYTTKHTVERKKSSVASLPVSKRETEAQRDPLLFMGERIPEVSQPL